MCPKGATRIKAGWRKVSERCSASAGHPAVQPVAPYQTALTQPAHTPVHGTRPGSAASMSILPCEPGLTKMMNRRVVDAILVTRWSPQQNGLEQPYAMCAVVSHTEAWWFHTM